jgi:hypothetical protein
MYQVFEKVFYVGIGKEKGELSLVHARMLDESEPLCGEKFPGLPRSCEDDPIECPQCCRIIRAWAKWGKDADQQYLNENLVYP